MSLRWKYLFVGSILFFSFICFSYLVHKNVFTQFDFDTTVRLQDNLSRRFDSIFSVLSDIGKFEVSILALLVILVVMRRIWAGIVTLVLFAGFHVIEIFGKFYVDHPPPPQFMLRTQHMIDFPQFHVRSEFSYPSGHAGRTAFLSILLFILILQSKRISPMMKVILCSMIGVYDIVMFLSRPYLGEHWMTDVLGGILLGGSLGLLSAAFFVDNKKGMSKPLFPRYKLEIKKVQ